MKRPRIENWTTDREAAELARLAAGKVVLEVGSFKGFGAVLMAQAGARVWAIDWHRGDQDLGERDTLCAWWTNVRRAGVEDQVVGLVGRSGPVMAALREGWFDLAFVDASHRLEDVRSDIRYVQGLVRPGGVIAFHDYASTWPGVVQAVDELRTSLGPRWPIRVVDSLAVLELPETSRASEWSD